MTDENQASLPEIKRLTEIMARLRDKDSGCPWDIEQSSASIARYALEEAYEVVDAIERNDIPALKEELGDLLLQVVFHAQMAKEDGLFDLEAVAKSINDKMVSRHPHVFGEVEVEDGEQVHANWESIKAEERKQKQSDNSLLADIPHAFPSLMRAQKLQKRAAQVGFDWPSAQPVYDKIDEELEEVKTAKTPEEVEEEIGDLLFVVVNLARHHKIHAEEALRKANHKFERRFREVESTLTTSGKTLGDASLDEMEAAWQAAKAKEKAA